MVIGCRCWTGLSANVNTCFYTFVSGNIETTFNTKFLGPTSCGHRYILHLRDTLMLENFVP